MIAIALPVGSSYGWGVCGKYLSRELFALTGGNARLLTVPFSAKDIGDELEFQTLASLLLPPQELAQCPLTDGIKQLPWPLLIGIADHTLVPAWPHIRGTRTAGYTFFENNIFQPAWIDNARRHFECVAAGSSWCADILKANGLENVQTVIQGIDPRIFFPLPDSREFLRDRFVIFSGGKFEYRKGQDIVIRAVKVMQERHPDVVLVNAWFNPWQASIDSMRRSPHLRWPAQPIAAGDHVAGVTRLLAENGLDIARVITLAARPNALMARIYRNSDVGLFPNRCEGGTNLVLMEYMACGKPVVATATTGHADIVTEANSLSIAIKDETTVTEGDTPVARWPEPDLDDTIAKLEWAYQHREALRGLGEQAGRDLAGRTWTHAAADFLKLLA